MATDPVRLRIRDSPRGVTAELAHHTPATTPTAVHGQVRLQVRGTQTDPGPPRESGRGVGAQPEMGRGHGRLFPFDLGTPQDRAPAFGEAGERTHDERGLRGTALPIEPIGVRAESGDEFLVGDGHVPAGGLPLPRDSSRHGQQIGTDVLLGSVAPADGLEHAEERLSRDVLGLGGVGHESTGQPAHGRFVIPEELTERGVVPQADALDQTRLIGCGVRVGQHSARHPLRAVALSVEL